MSALFLPRTFIYIGDRLGTDGKLSTGFILLPDSGEPWEEMAPSTLDSLPVRWWTLKGSSRSTARRLRVGAVIEMDTEIKEDGGVSIRVWTLRTLASAWHDREAVLRWTAEHRADLMEAERRKKMQGKDALHEALDPVREMYASLRGARRTAMLAEIVRYITS